MTDTTPRRRTLLIWAALGALYLVWGSLYLAVRYSVEAQPPLLSTGARFLVSGLVLLAATPRTRGVPWRRTWGPALVPGILLIGSAGLLAIGEQEVPSGIASLISATIPFFMVLLGATALRQRTRPVEWLGLAVGFAGAALLAGPGGEAPAWPLALVAASALGWAAGSVVAAAAPQEGGLLRAVARQTVAGGAVVTLAGLAMGEAGQLGAAAFGLRPMLAWAFLMVASSLVCYPAYVWLLGVARTSLVATYGYVNPVVAVLLGWAVAGERITGRTMLAAALVIGAVALVVTAAPAAGHPAGPPGPAPGEPGGTLGAGAGP
ncbi:MAG: EamA family transporter [Actinobacteria bacterium]|nr:EamA family transporter [Actinomycetota bacterium]